MTGPLHILLAKFKQYSQLKFFYEITKGKTFVNIRSRFTNVFLVIVPIIRILEILKKTKNSFVVMQEGPQTWESTQNCGLMIFLPKIIFLLS